MRRNADLALEMPGVSEDGVVVGVHTHAIRQHLLLVVEEGVSAEVVGEVGRLVRLPGDRPHGNPRRASAILIHSVHLSLQSAPRRPHLTQRLSASRQPAAPQLQIQRGRQSSSAHQKQNHKKKRKRSVPAHGRANLAD
jgi:hypothetical protein